MHGTRWRPDEKLIDPASESKRNNREVHYMNGHPQKENGVELYG